jgi:hypothetical protein
VRACGNLQDENAHFRNLLITSNIPNCEYEVKLARFVELF